MKKLLLFIALLISGMGLNAQTKYYVDGYGNFTITSVNPPECRLEQSTLTSDNSTYTIPEAVVINSTVYFVTSIGEEVFYGNWNIQGIVIPKGIKTIGNKAFQSCRKLRSVTFEENSQLVTIDEGAFSGSALKNIIIPKSVTNIEKEAFYRCLRGTIGYSAEESLESVTFEENSQLTYIGEEAFAENPNLQTVNFEATTQLVTIDKNAFYGCSSLQNVVFSDYSQLATIGSSAFYGCSSLLSVNFGNNSQLTTIGSSAFYTSFNDSSILSLDFGNNSKLSSIGNNAFENMAVNSLKIPNSVISIGEAAFRSCKNLTSLEMSNNITKISKYAFSNCISLTSLEIPSSVTSIGEDAFYGCSNLKALNFEEKSNLTTISKNAFYNCTSLTSLEIPSSVTTIGEKAFYDCSNLKVLNFEEKSNLTTISGSAFSGCTSLTSLEIPSSVVSIGSYAFHNCTSLISLDFGNDSQLTGCAGFYYCSNLINLEIPDKVTYIDGFWYSNKLEKIKCYAKEVPQVGNQFLMGVDKSLVKLLVPKDLYYLYKYSSPWNEFDICTGLDYDIIVHSCNEEYGSVVGGGNFMEDESVTIKATANTNYKFVSWTENGVVVSTNPEYSFVASANMNLVANFELETYNVTVQVVSGNMGTIEGAGIYSHGSEVTLTATAKDGYAFVCYMENEEVVSNNETYTFIVNSNRNLVVKFAEVLVPTNLVAVAESTSTIKLTWDEMYGAKSYEIYWSNGKPAIATVTENTYLVQDLEPYGYYGFKVAAVYNKKTSDKSDYVYIHTLDLPVVTPTNVIAEATSTTSILLTWDAVENALSYNIYKGATKVKNVTDNNCVIDYLNSYTDYCYTVTAVRNKTETSKSESACAKTFDLPIETPENVIAEATSTTSILLTWNAVENALSYNVYNGENLVANVTGTSYVVNNLDYYTDYCYTVTAVRNETETSKSESACAKTFDLPIETPENVIAEATSTTSISLTWDAVGNALSYNVYNGENLIANVTVTSYNFDNLDYYTDYCYTVTAVRNDTETSKSESACAKTFDLPIETPENVIAETTSISSISLTWDAVENALSYNVYNGENLVANVTNISYVVNNLDSYIEYCYTVTAVRNDAETSKSESACAKTFDLPIETPENVIAEATSTTSISLIWNAVENALSYNVYNGENLVANVTGTSYVVNNLDYYTDYCYTVTAVRNETETSKSESACAKTFDLPIETPENVIAEATSTTSISLTWNAVENALSYNVYNGENLIANVTVTSYNFDNLNYYTDYCYTVTAVRNETETSKSETACAKTFDLPIETPENVIAEATSTTSISLTWNVVGNALSYNVYRDDEFVENIINTNYVDNNLEYNMEYCYMITAVRNETESEKSEELCVKTLGETINEMSLSIDIYPTLTSDKLYIDFDEYIEEIRIYTMLGVVVYREIDFDNKSVDVSNFNSGVYFVMIKTSGGVVTKRFIKE